MATPPATVITLGFRVRKYADRCSMRSKAAVSPVSTTRSGQERRSRANTSRKPSDTSLKRRISQRLGDSIPARSTGASAFGIWGTRMASRTSGKYVLTMSTRRRVGGTRVSAQPGQDPSGVPQIRRAVGRPEPRGRPSQERADLGMARGITRPQIRQARGRPQLEGPIAVRPGLLQRGPEAAVRPPGVRPGLALAEHAVHLGLEEALAGREHGLLSFAKPVPRLIRLPVLE